MEENMWSFVEDDFQNVCWKQPKSILASSVADDWEGLPVNKWFEIFFKGGFPNKLPTEALSAGHMFGKMYSLILFTHVIGKYTCEYIKIEFRSDDLKCFSSSIFADIFTPIQGFWSINIMFLNAFEAMIF